MHESSYGPTDHTNEIWAIHKRLAFVEEFIASIIESTPCTGCGSHEIDFSIHREQHGTSMYTFYCKNCKLAGESDTVLWRARKNFFDGMKK